MKITIKKIACIVLVFFFFFVYTLRYASPAYAIALPWPSVLFNLFFNLGVNTASGRYDHDLINMENWFHDFKDFAYSDKSFDDMTQRAIDLYGSSFVTKYDASGNPYIDVEYGQCKNLWTMFKSWIVPKISDGTVSLPSNINYNVDGMPLNNAIRIKSFGSFSGRYLSCDVDYRLYRLNVCNINNKNKSIDAIMAIKVDKNIQFTADAIAKPDTNPSIPGKPVMLMVYDSDFHRNFTNGTININNIDNYFTTSGFAIAQDMGLLIYGGADYCSYNQYKAYGRSTQTIDILRNARLNSNFNGIEFTNIINELVCSLQQYVFYPITVATSPISIPYDTEGVEDVIGSWGNAIGAGDIGNDVVISLPLPATDADVYTSLLAGIDALTASNAQQARLIALLQQAIIDAQTAAKVGASDIDIDIDDVKLSTAIMTRFPFCIPFDLYNAFAAFSGLPRKAPKWSLPWSVNGVNTSIDIDLSYFDKLATVVRWGVLISFNIGLILITRRLIKA
ncbi:MAG: hypothetical protein RR232_01045 [Clostridia bacterium]